MNNISGYVIYAQRYASNGDLQQVYLTYDQGPPKWTQLAKNAKIYQDIKELFSSYDSAQKNKTLKEQSVPGSIRIGRLRFEVDEVDIETEKDIVEHFRNSALSKLTVHEIKALGLEKEAMFHKLTKELD